MTTTKQSNEGRAAYSLAEFADLFGKDRSWGYKLAKQPDKLRVIRGYGKLMVPASEVERITEGREL